jgi:hypothetical protein
MDKTDAALALSVAALVPAIYSGALPNLSTLRATPDHGGAQQGALRSATATAAAVVLVAGVVLRSRPALVVGGAVVVAQALSYGLAVPLPRH